MTFASTFDDLREDVLGDFLPVLHGSLPVLNPLCSSCAQQTARFPHFINERSVLWIQLQDLGFLDFKDLTKLTICLQLNLCANTEVKSHRKEDVSDIVHHPFQTHLNGSGES